MTKLTRDALIQTDAEIEAAFDDTLTIDDLSFVDTTIAEFLAARSNWAQPGRIVEQTECKLVIDGVQPLKGQPRRTLTVIDFGTARAVDGATK